MFMHLWKLLKVGSVRLGVRLKLKKRSKIELDPFVIARKAIAYCLSLMKLQGVTRGGTTYQMPFPVEEAEAEFRAIKIGYMPSEVCTR
ncbi:unnamed protein product [Cylicocyclus nassatus]|uniref:Uncharacterized protein n=1 Tax=Cylicocyclus nassatus TaxID=53992 RepID=A0AA36DV82_CYLNA|nr:unnamed protein product [Cylicocyclus nassatus]